MQDDFSAPAKNTIVYMYNNELVDTIQFGGNTIKYTPDINGQVETIAQNGQHLATFANNSNGMLETTSLGNSNSIFNTYIGNDTLLTSQIFNTTSSTIWDTHTYDYDANKQITKVINSAVFCKERIHSIAIATTQCCNLTWSLCGHESQDKKLAKSRAGFATKGYHAHHSM